MKEKTADELFKELGYKKMKRNFFHCDILDNAIL